MNMSQTQEKAYKVLARKYRPQHFDELIGQDALVRTLKNAIETNRIAHAYMLTGVRGVGKTTTARIIAKALNYTGSDGQAGPTTGPTDDCETCQAITSDRHPDVMEMDAASRTGVDDIREILDGVRYAPVSARYKVYIIDEVHMLSRQAFNALLKTLEEPPEHVIFIFATTEIRKVPVTVLSRCQRFDLRRVDVDTLKSYYKQICDKEQVEIEDDALLLIGQSADGSVRDGLSLLDQAIAQSDSKITLSDVQDMLGLADRSQILSLYKAALTGDSPQSLELVASLFKNGADPSMVLQDLIDLTHGLTKLKAAGNQQEKLNMSPDMAEQAADLAGKLSMPSLGRAWDILLQGLKDIQTAPNPENAAEMTVIKLSYAANLPDPAKLLADLQETGGVSAPQTKASASPGTAAPVKEPVKAGADPTRDNALVPTSASSSGSVGAQAVQKQPETAHHTNIDLSTLENIVGALEQYGHLRLAMDVRQFIHLVSLKQNRLEFNPGENTPKGLANELQTRLGEISGERWFVSITSAPGATSLIEQERARQAEYMEQIRQHPFVKKVLEAFPAAEIDTVTSIEDQESK